MSNRNILVLKGDSNKYKNPFEKWGSIMHDADNLEHADLVVFAGGTDVNPTLYGEEPHPMTSAPDLVRDTFEQAVYTRALILELPMVGICRGAQFLTVMNNGKLKQHITGHQSCTHTINTSDGAVFEVAGDHHQAMLPDGHHHVLAVSDDGINEAVYFPSSRSLCVQYHPEWMSEDSEGYKYFQKLLDLYVM